jgi:hypothetical protein
VPGVEELQRGEGRLPERQRQDVAGWIAGLERRRLPGGDRLVDEPFQAALRRPQLAVRRDQLGAVVGEAPDRAGARACRLDCHAQRLL